MMLLQIDKSVVLPFSEKKSVALVRLAFLISLSSIALVVVFFVNSVNESSGMGRFLIPAYFALVTTLIVSMIDSAILARRRAGISLNKPLLFIRLIITLVISFSFITVVDSLVYKQQIDAYALQEAKSAWELKKNGNELYLTHSIKLKELRENKQSLQSDINSMNIRIEAIKAKKQHLEKSIFEGQQTIVLLKRKRKYQLEGFDYIENREIPSGDGKKYNVIDNDINLLNGVFQENRTKLNAIQKKLNRFEKDVGLIKREILDLESSLKSRERALLRMQQEFSVHYSQSIFVKFLGLYSVFLSPETALVAMVLTVLIAVLSIVIEFLPYILFHLSNMRGNDSVYARYHKLLHLKEDQRYRLDLAEINESKGGGALEVVSINRSSGGVVEAV